MLVGIYGDVFVDYNQSILLETPGYRVWSISCHVDCEIGIWIVVIVVEDLNEGHGQIFKGEIVCTQFQRHCMHYIYEKTGVCIFELY